MFDREVTWEVVQYLGTGDGLGMGVASEMGGGAVGGWRARVGIWVGRQQIVSLSSGTLEVLGLRLSVNLT